MRSLRCLASGRARIWWVTHRQDAIRASQLVAIVGLYLLASTMDHQDQLEAERLAKEEAQLRLVEERALHGIPNPAIVLDARTAEKFGLRLAEIAGGLDSERYGLRGAK